MKRILFIVLCAVLLSSCLSCSPAEEESHPPEKLRVTCIIPSRIDTSFWRDIDANMRKASEDLNMDATMIYVGTSGRLAIRQSDATEIAILAETQAIVTAYPNDDQKTADLLRDARKSGIYVVLIDSDSSKDIRDVFVGLDNSAAGDALGRAALKKLESGRSALLIASGARRHPHMAEREDAIRRAFDENSKELEILIPTTHNDLLLASLIEEELRNNNIGVIISTTERNTVICSQVIKRLDMTGSVALYGFDRSEDTMELLEKGEIQALLCQRHAEMGYEGVKTAASLIRGVQYESDTQAIEFEILYADGEKGD